ncbi:CLUMA_CG016547, isoform A [Clunio marinus]|uniref:CLUMA_CG016547, isoform A n=1 Tax=Clunio marinus TaxID=568069 RepID=A0A1J1IRY1_9DIPT|nr:CLUMA_CG016547, isoform A [Clunio marinus]
MKFLFAFATVIAIALASPQWYDEVASSISSIGMEGYKFASKISDEKTRPLNSKVQNVGTDKEAMVFRGSYTFIDEDDQKYIVTYIVNKDGLQTSDPHNLTSLNNSQSSEKCDDTDFLCLLSEAFTEM